MQFTQGHIGFTETCKNAVMSEVFAMQCCGSRFAALLNETPMSRRNDAYTAIYFYRYC